MNFKSLLAGFIVFCSSIPALASMCDLAEGSSLPVGLDFYYIYKPCQFGDGLTPVRDHNDNIGYVNRTGQLVLPLDYSYVGRFRNGLAIVKNDLGWGIIDNDGNQVVATVYKWIGKFKEGRARVKLELPHPDLKPNSVYRTVDKYGFINTQGELIIPPVYDFAFDFNEGLASVEKDGYDGFIDRLGNPIIDFQYDYAEEFSEGLAMVEVDNKRGYIDRQNNMVIEPQPWVTWHFKFGTAIVRKGGLEDSTYGAIDRDGNTVIPFIYQEIRQIDNGNFWVKKDDQYFMLDRDLNPVDSHRYDIHQKFGNTLYLVKENNQYGLLTHQGEIVLPLEYELIQGLFFKNMALAVKEGYYGYIDYYGNTIIPLMYKQANIPQFRLMLVSEQGEAGTFGYINKDNETVIPFNFDNYYNPDNDYLTITYNLYEVVRDGLHGVYNGEGVEIVPPVYDDLINYPPHLIGAFYPSHLISALKDGELSILNMQGDVLIPPTYDNIYWIKLDPEDSVSKSLWTNEGHIAVAKVDINQKYGIINEFNETIVPLIYDSIGDIRHGLVRVEKDGKYGVLNHNSEVIIPLIYQDLTITNEGFIIVSKDTYFGILDVNNEIVVPFEYDMISKGKGEWAKLSQNGDEYYINLLELED